MKAIILATLLQGILFIGYAQYSRHIIELTDKKGTVHSLSNPLSFLSPETIARRKQFNIAIDSTDLPVSKLYLDSIAKAGKVEILNTSKWLNQVLIKTTDQAALNKISQYSFVKKRSPIASRPSTINEEKFIESITETNGPQTTALTKTTTLNYGNSSKQVSIHEGEFLHNKGFQGNGMKIAVLDAGFFKYQNIAAFDSLKINGRLKMTWDFVDNNTSVNEDDAHGMHCLSILAANLPGAFVGTAPASSYYLFRTEDVASEFPVEEQNWLAAAEKADSIGIQMISSSLGYNTFDDASFNYTYADMNGKKTMITRGAAMASNKGMIVMNSAGNSGSNAWKYLIAPADGIDVLAVGAVNNLKQIAPFSSYGPSSDNRIKPDIASVGWNTFLISTSGNVAQGNGTSFSNPNIAGLIACLWQAFPEFSNKEIIEAVRKSGDRFNTPDARTGYGIPNMRLAYGMLEKERNIRKAKGILKSDRLRIYPNPMNDQFTIVYNGKANGKLSVQLLSAEGKLIRNLSYDVMENEYYFFNVNGLGTLSSGQYVLSYQDNVGSGSLRIMK
jgi:subtilisin family serine protease